MQEHALHWHRDAGGFKVLSRLPPNLSDTGGMGWNSVCVHSLIMAAFITVHFRLPE